MFILYLNLKQLFSIIRIGLFCFVVSLYSFNQSKLHPSFNWIEQNIPTDSIANNYLENHKNQRIQLQGQLFSGKIISIQYKTLQNNNPKQNDNWVGIWQGSQVHYNEKPLRKYFIQNTTQDGGFNFDSLQLNNLQYIVGYGVSKENTSIVATLYFNRDSLKGTPFSTKISTLNIGQNQLTYRFETPLGNTPYDNKNWVGIWKGQTFSYDGTNNIKRVRVTSNVSCGVGSINGLNLERDTWYTLVYGVGNNWEDIGATFSFRTK